jgi:hypothetical protein
MGRSAPGVHTAWGPCLCDSSRCSRQGPRLRGGSWSPARCQLGAPHAPPPSPPPCLSPHLSLHRQRALVERPHHGLLPALVQPPRCALELLAWLALLGCGLAAAAAAAWLPLPVAIVLLLVAIAALPWLLHARAAAAAARAHGRCFGAAAARRSRRQGRSARRGVHSTQRVTQKSAQGRYKITRRAIWRSGAQSAAAGRIRHEVYAVCMGKRPPNAVENGHVKPKPKPM